MIKALFEILGIWALVGLLSFSILSTVKSCADKSNNDSNEIMYRRL